MRKIKRCKYCGAKNITISHFAKKHGAILRRRAAASRRKAPRATRPSKRSRRAVTFTPGGPPAGAYGPRLLPICYGPCAGGPPHVHGP